MIYSVKATRVTLQKQRVGIFEVCVRGGGCQELEQERHYFSVVSSLCLLSALPSLTFLEGSNW